MTDETNAQAPSTSGEPDPAVVAVTETKVYSDGSSATGPGPLPDLSPAQQEAAQATAPLPDPASIQTSTGGVRTAITELEHARALPEIADGVAFHEAQAAEGTVHHFYDEAVNAAGIVERRVMRVVVAMDGLLHKIHTPNFGE